MKNNLFDPSFKLCMLYYLIEINGTLLIFYISLIYKQFFFPKMHLTNLINMNFLSRQASG